MLDPDKLTAAFYEWAKREIESSGEYLLANAIWYDTEKDGVIMESLDLQPNQIVFRCVNTIDSDRCSFMIFGLDMAALPGQGLEFDDFVLVFQWQKGSSPPYQGDLKDQLRIGVINYRKGDNPIVRDIDWENAYWKDHAYNLIREFVPFRVRVQRAKA